MSQIVGRLQFPQHEPILVVVEVLRDPRDDGGFLDAGDQPKPAAAALAGLTLSPVHNMVSL